MPKTQWCERCGREGVRRLEMVYEGDKALEWHVCPTCVKEVRAYNRLMDKTQEPPYGRAEVEAVPLPI